MSTFRATLAKFALPLVGLFLILEALMLLFGLAVPPILLGIVALLAGIACWCAS